VAARRLRVPSPLHPITLAGYRLGETLDADGCMRLARAERVPDGARLLARLPCDLPNAQAALRHEHQVLASLSIDGVAQPIGWADEGALLFEDRATQTLAGLAAKGRLQLGWVLDYAEQLAAALAALHRCGIVHRALRPAAVWVDAPAGRVRLADFSDAARDPAEAAAPLAPQLYGSRLAYAAPEQTGRVGRGCDHRSDFYALGVLLYESLAGRLPFAATDPLELIHAHLAKVPPPLAEAVPGLPLPVSQIVTKLLAKAPDERYQGAAALQRDLQRCRSEWARRGSVAAFAIGQRDVPERFTVPQRLYGRGAELAALTAAYERAGRGAAALALVDGPAGVGKTALIGALQQAVTRGGGRFVAGKFDQLSLDVPYSALVQALRQLVGLLLAQPEAQLDEQRQRLAQRLGAGSAVIAAFVPELQIVLGEQAPPWPLPPVEAQNRFTLAFQDFIAALATPEQPLVIFLDDLQWADAATLHLLGPLLAGAGARCLLLVGALRELDLEAGHPLAAALAALERGAVPVERIALHALEPAALVQLTADTLHVDAAEAAPLAELLLAKTDGNPFFVTQFLQALHKDGLITFDAERSRWTAHLAAIADAPITDNVVDLMSRKIAQLAPAMQHMLSLAACVGNRFDLDTLCAVSEQPREAVASDLAAAAIEGLVVAQGEGRFAFLHDRVQQAAYARLASDEGPYAHLRIGRALAQRWRGERDDATLFDMASQLNLGAGLIETRAERVEVARIQLAAGCKARQSSAHAAALGFFEAGLALLDDAHWATHRDLAFELHLEAAQSLYLCGRFDAAEAAFLALLPRCADALESARVHNLRMVQFESRGRYDEAQASARTGLALLGVDLPQAAADKEAALAREIAAIDAKLGTRAIASLVELPAMTDAATRRVMGILTDIWSATYILGDAVLTRLISATLVRLSLQHGNCEESAYGYVTHAITVGPVRGDYAAAYEFGVLALAVNERLNDRRRRAKIYQQFHAHVALWCRPMHECIGYAREAWRSGLESGDFLYAAYGASTQSWPAIVSCQDLAACLGELTPNLALVERLRNQPFADALRLVMAWAHALRGHTESALSLTHAQGVDAFDEQRYLQAYGGNPFFTMFRAIAKLHLAYLHDEIDAAHAAARSVRETAHQLIGMVWSVLFEVWNGLTLAAYLHRTPDVAEREAWLAEIEAAQRALATLARHCAANFACHALLLEAELDCLQGHTLVALERYEAALAAADASGEVQQRALAHELVAKYWLRRGNRRIGALYLLHALDGYARWGAHAKVLSLRERHAALLDEAAAPLGGSAAPAGGAALVLAQLDLAAIVKAAQALAEPLEAGALIERLLRLAIEHAGARGGALIEDLDGELRVSAVGSAEGGTAALPRGLLLAESAAHCSAAVVQYVARTRASLAIGDVARDERFVDDARIATFRPRSILCLPIAHQGRLTSILYLEHDLVREAFSPRRIEVLQLLLAQAASSLHNARLAQRIGEAVGERERAEVRLRAIEAATANVTGMDFFRALVSNMAQALHVRFAFAAEALTGADGCPAARMRAFWKADHFGTELEYEIAGTPCQEVLGGQTLFWADDVQTRYPSDSALSHWGVKSYLGMPLLGTDGKVIGHIAILDPGPIADAQTARSVMGLCAGRAGAELERLQAAEGQLRALNEVKLLRDRLQEENVYLRRELIANVSHDLRSPLASLRGYLDTLLLKEQTLSAAERRSYLSIASRQTERLQSLIDELFELARLDFQGYRIAAEPVQLGELVGDVVQKFQLAAQAKGVMLGAEASAELPFVHADIALIERAISNLIDNALAHTPAGGCVELVLWAERPTQVTVSVRDSGRGIAAEDLPRVFERFYRADKARRRSAGGSGLGLAIVKRIVELHGGQVQVESREGEGARFWFSLRAAA
jgi:predicted ATPase/signal transduction histidine kinase